MENVVSKYGSLALIEVEAERIGGGGGGSGGRRRCSSSSSSYSHISLYHHVLKFITIRICEKFPGGFLNHFPVLFDCRIHIPGSDLAGSRRFH